MAVNPDFRDLFSALNDAGVEYLVVGAHAVIFYGRPRFTKDLDVWVNPTLANAQRLWKALAEFGAPLERLRLEDFTDPDLVYQIGVEPNRIDVMMGIGGVPFDEAWGRRVSATYGGVPIWVIGKQDLLKSKRTADRAQDRLDVAEIEAGEEGERT